MAFGRPPGQSFNKMRTPMVAARSSPDSSHNSSSLCLQMRRQRDACPSPGDSFENSGGRGIRERDTAKIELKFNRVGDQRRRTSVLQAPHIHHPQAPPDNHTQNVAVAIGADCGHVPGSWQSASLSRHVAFVAASCSDTPACRNSIHEASLNSPNTANSLPKHLRQGRGGQAWHLMSPMTCPAS